MAVNITEVIITPQTTTVGNSVLIQVRASDNSWGNIKEIFTSWQTIKDNAVSWQDIYTT